jgi:hypothetical protein
MRTVVAVAVGCRGSAPWKMPFARVSSMTAQCAAFSSSISAADIAAISVSRL